MNPYTQHLFSQFVLKSTSPQFSHFIKPHLFQHVGPTFKPIPLTKLYKQLTSSPQLFNELMLLIAKGVLRYSPANCTVELVRESVMVYGRLAKVGSMAGKYLNKEVAEFIETFIEQGVENGMGFPVAYEKKRLAKVLSLGTTSQPLSKAQQQAISTGKQQKRPKSKPKPTQPIQHKPQPLQPLYNYHKLIYQYKSSQVTQKSQHLQQSLNGKKPSKSSKKQQPPQTQQTDQYMLNVQQLTRLLKMAKFLQAYNRKLTVNEKKLGFFEFMGLKDLEKIMLDIKYEKIEEWIAQSLGRNCLLLFNLIRKYPLITEKELSKLTLLQILQTRTAINQLAQKGLIHFYVENPRTIVYRIIDLALLEQKYVDTLARTMLNLSIAQEKVLELVGVSQGMEKVKDRMIHFQCEIQRLDDVLVMFGW